MRRLESAVHKLRRRTRLEPRATLVLGPGMEALADEVSMEASLDYSELLDRDEASSEERGRMLIGHVRDLPVAVMQGVLPRYEGHTLDDTNLPVRAMRLLGAAGPPPPLLIVGACTSLHPLSQPGELVLLDDHINLMGENPLVGPNLDALGPRFPDMSEPYDRTLQRVAVDAALDRRIPLRRGVYVAVTGPQLPTRAEYRMFRSLGGDFTGTWIVPEVIVARHMGMRVLALLAVDMVRLPDVMQPVDAAAAGRISDDVRSALGEVLKTVLERLPAGPDSPGW